MFKTLNSVPASVMGRVERQQRQREEMQHEIRRAAMKLFLEHGFEQTSVRKIADEIGYTPGAIYSYFKDKDEILYSLHDEGFDKLFALQATTIAISDPFQRLVKCGELYLKFAMEQPEYYELMFISRSTAKKIQEAHDANEDWKPGMRTYDFLRALVKECMDKGVIVKHDLEAASFAFWATVHGMAALVIRGRCPMIAEEDLPNVVASALEFVMKSSRRTKK